MTALLVILAVFVVCFIIMAVVCHNAMPYDPSWDDDDKKL